jgi:hypothetical protein
VTLELINYQALRYLSVEISHGVQGKVPYCIVKRYGTHTVQYLYVKENLIVIAHKVDCLTP